MFDRSSTSSLSPVVQLCLIALISLISLDLSLTPIFATIPTAPPLSNISPTVVSMSKPVTTSPSAATTQALLERINQKAAVDEETTVQKTLETIDKLRQAYMGEVEKVSDESIRVKLSTGPVIIPMEKIDNIRKNDKQIKPSDIEVGNWIVVIGATQPGTAVSKITPEKILVYTTSPRPQPIQVMAGTLQKLDKSNIQILSRADGQNATFSLLKTTRFFDDTGKVIKSSQLVNDLSVLVTGYADGDTKYAATIRSLAPLNEVVKAQ